MRRKCEFAPDPFVNPSIKEIGFCLMITGGMMSAPTAVIEKLDGTLANIAITDVRFIQAPKTEGGDTDGE